MSTVPHALGPADLVQRSATVLFTEVNGEAVLLAPAGDAYVGLDAIGTEIWRRLETGRRVEQLCREICDQFAGEPSLIAREVIAFLENLRAHDLLQLPATPADC